MENHIALLRAVNVGGRNSVPMASLRALLTSVGFEDVRTLLQSGNVVFRARDRSPAEFEGQLEAVLAERMAVRTDVFVRKASEWDVIVRQNPLQSEAATDPSHLVVLLLRTPPDAGAVALLQGAIKGREVLVANGRELYASYPDGIGDSKLTIGVIERLLNTRVTGRNWNTVLKLAEMARV